MVKTGENKVCCQSDFESKQSLFPMFQILLKDIPEVTFIKGGCMSHNIRRKGSMFKSLNDSNMIRKGSLGIRNHRG